MGNIKNIKSSDVFSVNTLNAKVWKKSSAWMLVCLVSGCALFPPPPAQCNGQFKPVNAPIEKNTNINQPPVESSADSTAGEPDKALRSDEGAIDGK